MWPRIISQLEQLAELLPYLKHIAPLADKFLASRSANDAAVTSLVEGVRSDLARMAPANAELSSQLGELSTEVNRLTASSEDTRALTTSLGNGILALERQLRSLRALVVAALVLIAVLTLMTAWLMVTHARS